MGYNNNNKNSFYILYSYKYKKMASEETSDDDCNKTLIFILLIYIHSDACHNTYGDDATCDLWARQGQCDTTEWMMDNCERACGLCLVGEQTLHDGCSCGLMFYTFSDLVTNLCSDWSKHELGGGRGGMKAYYWFSRQNGIPRELWVR